jgi:hypothetical protein
MVDESSNALNRRKFMKRAATTGAISLGVTATSATGAMAAVPASPDRAETLLDTHADGVLSMLEADGVLAERSDLPTAVGNDFRGIARGSEGAAMLTTADRPEELKVVKSVDAGTLTVTVQPESNRAFAVLDTGDGKVAYDLENGRYDFGTMDHDCDCTGNVCATNTCIEECCGGGSCHYDCDCGCY